MATLDAVEAHHCINVLRCNNDEDIEIIDGKGTLYVGVLNILNKKNILVRDLKIVEQHPNNHLLTIAVAPTKNNARIEWLVEKLVELGVKDIILLHTEHTEKTYTKIDRLQQIIIAAAKQSKRLWLPTITDWHFKDVISTSNEYKYKYIAHCNINDTKYKTELDRQSSTLVMIGPEGDFSSKEIQLAITNGYIPLDLGSLRLRTETAAMAVAAKFL